MNTFENPTVRASHQQLSQFGETFVDFLKDNPAFANTFPNISAIKVPSFVKVYPLQPYPILIGKQQIKEIADAALGVARLVKSIPTRIFEGNAARISDFYNIQNEMIADLLVSEPNGIDYSLTRGDFIYDEDAFKCLELNCSSRLGGWQVYFYSKMYRNNPQLNDFYAKNGIVGDFTDANRALVKHMIQMAIDQGLNEKGRINMGIAVDPGFEKDVAFFFNRLYSEIAEEMGVSGRAFGISYPHGYRLQRSRIYSGSNPLHILLEYQPAQSPKDIFRAFKMGHLILFNSPVSYLLGDKRNLSLLSEHDESDRYTAEERRLIKNHLPWSRNLVPGKVSYKGETDDIAKLLIGNKDRFIIKGGQGYGGDNVHVGRFIDPNTWRIHVEGALQEGNWLAQEFLASKPYIALAGKQTVPHDVIWGIYGMGNTYGGGFLRMQPVAGGDGIINAARGATEALIYEHQ